MLEFRFILDCETMEKALQYREVVSENVRTSWLTVPTIMGIISDDGRIATYDSEK